MHGNIQRELPPTNVCSGNALPLEPTSHAQRQHSAEPLFFALLCRELWGANAAKELQFRLGRSERTCRAWAAGDSPPPINVLVALLHEDDCGAAVLVYIMRGSAAAWWRAHERALRIAAQIDQLNLD